MKEKIQSLFMWLLAAPLTAVGFDSAMHRAETLLGVLTTLLGFMIGVCGFIWWLRRLKRQSIKLTLDELQLRHALQGKKKHHSVKDNDE